MNGGRRGTHVPGDSKAMGRWLNLSLICTAQLMTLVDSPIVNIALPSIREDLNFSGQSLVWVVNGYLLSYGGLLLLAGRLSDLFGPRRLFLFGVALFAMTSLACGLAPTRSWLIAGRIIQGASGAVVTSTVLSLILRLFPAPEDRAKAMGAYSFVCASGGIVGTLAGGLLVSVLSWRWIFFVNIPFGVVAFGYGLALMPKDPKLARTAGLDVAGALLITSALVTASYATVTESQDPVRRTGLLIISGILLALFVAVEATVKTPILPLGLFRLRLLVLSNLIGILWVSATLATYYTATLYLQRVLHSDAMHVSLDFLPGSLIMAAFSLGISSRIVGRYGIKWPTTAGLLMCASGLALLAVPQILGGFSTAVLSAMILLGVGSGMAFSPLLLTALSEVKTMDSGLASGVFNTSLNLGGALGFWGLTSASAGYTADLILGKIDVHRALAGGYQLAFALGSGCIAGAALLVGAYFPRKLASLDKAASETSATHPYSTTS